MRSLSGLVVFSLVAFQSVCGFASILSDTHRAIKANNVRLLAQILSHPENINQLKEEMYDVAVEDGKNLLILTTQANDSVFQLVDERLKPEWSRRGPNGEVPGIHWGRVKPFQLIETGRFNVLSTDKLGSTILHRVAGEGDIDVIKIILSKAEEASEGGARVAVNALNKKRESPLFEAVIYGQMDAMKHLLDRGANPKLGRPLLVPVIDAEIYDKEEQESVEVGAEAGENEEPVRSLEKLEKDRAENLERARVLIEAGALTTEADAEAGGSFYSLAKLHGLSRHVKLALSSPSFEWKKLIKEDLRLLDLLPKYLMRQPGSMVGCSDDLSAYSNAPNFLDMVQVGLGMDCSICSSLAGTSEGGDISKDIDGDNRLAPIAIHSCGNAFCGACYNRWENQQREAFRRQRSLHQLPVRPQPTCANCKQKGNFYFSSPFTSQVKDRRLEKQPAPRLRSASLEAPLKKARIAE